MTDTKQLSLGWHVLRMTARALYRMQGTGLPRVAESIRRRTARWAARHPDRALIQINNFCGNLVFCCDLSEHMGSQIFFKGGYSGEQLVVLRRLLTPDAVFVDIGANQGEFTVCAAGCVPDGQVIAFEPVLAVCERLERNIAANQFNNVTVHSVGLSDINQDDIPIFGADSEFSDGTQNIGLPTLFSIAGRGTLLAHISLRRLDDLLPSGQRVDVMKIDVEGAELAVMKGAAETIRREKPAIIFEANYETAGAVGYSLRVMYEWLNRQGYQLHMIGSAGELYPLNEKNHFCNILAQHPGTPTAQNRLMQQ